MPVRDSHGTAMMAKIIPIRPSPEFVKATTQHNIIRAPQMLSPVEHAASFHFNQEARPLTSKRPGFTQPLGRTDCRRPGESKSTWHKNSLWDWVFLELTIGTGRHG